VTTISRLLRQPSDFALARRGFSVSWAEKPPFYAA